MDCHKSDIIEFARHASVSWDDISDQIAGYNINACQ